MGKIRDLSEKNSESLVLVLQGLFYHAEGKSAEALASITGYKLRKMEKGEVECGFPYGSLDKIMEHLEDKDIKYLIYQNDKIIYSGGNVVLEEYLKDANIPPPVSKNTKVRKEQKTVELVPITFRCPKDLADRLKTISDKEWQSSFDVIIVRILEKGLRDG